MFKTISAAVIASAMFASGAVAATISGNFTVTAINVIGIDSDDSQASMANYNTAMAGTFSPAAMYAFSTFDYIGELNFGTSNSDDSTTIASWLATGTPGGVSGLDDDFGDLQLSKPNIDDGTATTTFFFFQDNLGDYASGDLTIKHDDGVSVFDVDGNRIGGFLGPNGERTTEVNGFTGGSLDFLYVATNGDPSVFRVDLETVPLPAGLPLMLAGLGGFAIVRRKKARLAA